MEIDQLQKKLIVKRQLEADLEKSEEELSRLRAKLAVKEIKLKSALEHKELVLAKWKEAESSVPVRR